MPSQISGQAPQPSPNQRRRPRKPKVVSAGNSLGGFVGQAGGTIAKSAGHAAHDARHAAGKIVKSINPFD